MESENKLNENLQKTKNTLAAGNFKAQSETLPVVRTNKRKLSYSIINKNLLACFRKEDYETLQADLLLIGKQGVIDFFSSSGKSLLSWTLISAQSHKPLDFLVKNLPIKLLQQTLSNTNFFILKSFLLGQSGMEQLSLVNQETRACRIEKFNLLLKIDPEGIQSFMKRHNAEGYMTDKIKSDFQIGLNNHIESQNCNEKPRP